MLGICLTLVRFCLSCVAFVTYFTIRLSYWTYSRPVVTLIYQCWIRIHHLHRMSWSAIYEHSKRNKCGVIEDI